MSAFDDEGKQFPVYAVLPSDVRQNSERRFRIGTARVKDGVIAIELNALPVNGRDL